MKRLFILFLLTGILWDYPTFAKKKPNLTPEQIAQSYDFNIASDRYRWYQDVRNHIAKNGGLRCAPGTPLRIEKDGTFLVDRQIQLLKDGFILLTPQDAECISSVKSLKRFPLPQSYPGESVVFPIRGHASGPMTDSELDTIIFKLPVESPPK